MQAFHIPQPGQLALTQRPTPTPGPHEVCIAVAATALNRADLLQVAGQYPPPPGVTDVPGLEVAGHISALGAEVTRWQVGDAVCALLPGGGYAEYATAHQGSVMAVPQGLSITQAAALPEAFLTAHQALRLLGDLRPGGRVLLHAGGSGVGTAAIQLARLIGAEVFVTASAGKHAACQALGAHHTIDYQTEAFDTRIAEQTAGQGVALIVDVVGAPYFEANLRCLALDGRLILLAGMGGMKVKDASLARILTKRLHLIGSTLRNRSDAYKAHLLQDFLALAGNAFTTGRLAPVIDRILPWTEAPQAHQYMAQNQNTGKIVLQMNTKR